MIAQDKTKARVLSEQSLLLQKHSMVSLRREQGVAVVPGLVLKASSLYGAPGTVNTWKGPSRVREDILALALAAVMIQKTSPHL